MLWLIIHPHDNGLLVCGNEGGDPTYTRQAARALLKRLEARP